MSEKGIERPPQPSITQVERPSFNIVLTGYKAIDKATPTCFGEYDTRFESSCGGCILGLPCARKSIGCD